MKRWRFSAHYPDTRCKRIFRHSRRCHPVANPHRQGEIKVPTKQFVEKLIASDKELKREYKETKETKDIKDKDKDKDKDKEKEKEHKEKEIFKEIHKEELLEYPQTHYPAVGPGPEATQTAVDANKIVETKQISEKLSFKEFKVEKYEIKEYKHEIKEHKYEIKEIEKIPIEGKVLTDGPYNPGQGGDPYAQRLAALEATVAQLVHFIPAELRPDLSQGALKQEPETTEATASKATAPKEKDAKK
jgi:hypothetical protein